MHPVGGRGRRAVVYGLFLLVHAAVAALFLTDRSPGDASAALGLPLDDSWIHLVYARSFAAFDGFAYDPGMQAAGFTSPLWVVILAPLFWMRLPWDVSLVLVVKIVGVLFAWGTSIWACRVATRIAGLGAGIIVGLLVALDPWLGFAAVSGMEVHLAALTMLAAFDMALAERWRASGIALALALWSRPETVVVAAVLVGAVAWNLRHEGSDRTPLRRLAVPPLLAGAAWSAWCVAVSGRLLPSAFYIKHQSPGLLTSVEDVPRVLVDQLFDSPWFFAGSGLVLLALGAWRIVRDAPARGLRRQARIALLVSIPVWLLAIAWAHRINEPLAFYWHRYVEPGYPLLLLPVSVGLWWVLSIAWTVARRRAPPTGWRLAMTLAALPLLGLATWTLPSKLQRNAELQAWSAANIQELQVRLGVWLRGHSDPDDWVVTHDAGAIRFVSERRVIDMLGINDPRVLDGSLPRVLAEDPPRYIVIIPSWYPDLVTDPRTREVYRVHADHFVICEHCQQDEMVVLESAGRSR